MNLEIEKYIDEIRDSIKKNEFYERIDFILKDIEQLENSEEAIEPLIKIIQENSEFDFGNPGEIVHFLEKYDEEKYDKILVNCIKENPTEHTIFMFNRIINSVTTEKKVEYLEMYKELLESNKINVNLKNRIKEYLNFQEGNKLEENNNKFIYSNITLINLIENPKDLIVLKKLLGIEKSIIELTKEAKNLPYVLIKNITENRAKKIIEKLGELQKYIKIERIE